ncbi:uncharacterized protein [Lepeophtheirus salmonis]|uniref:uncharacterized protein isoform X1 n=2 Tax=Lepeophtheirus salmonis TaxID=72036 RepID=UPI003AF35F49
MYRNVVEYLAICRVDEGIFHIFLRKEVSPFSLFNKVVVWCDLSFFLSLFLFIKRMSSLESPLDVLSRAATMVEKSSISSNLKQSDKGCERSSSFKERHPKFRKSSTPEYLLAAGNKRRNSREFHPLPSSSEGEMETTDEEGPLDMSIKKRDRSPPPPYPINFSSGSPPSISLRDLPPPPSYEVAISKRYSDSLHRPGSTESNKENEDTRPIREITIITDSCADPLLDEHFRRSLGANYKSLFKKSPVSQEDGEDESSPENDSNVKQSSSNNNSPSSRKTDLDDDERVRVINAEDTERDHIVEMDQEGSTVEDHFAKALGETWIKLQAAASKSSSSSSSSSTSPPPPRRTNTPQLVTTS